MSDSPITTEPAAPSSHGADEADSARTREGELDAALCALMDRVAALEARLKDLEDGIV